MDNLARILRLNNIFGPHPSDQSGPTLSDNMPGSPMVMNAAPAPMQNQAPSTNQQPDANQSVGDLLQSLYTPEHTYSDMYKADIDAMPQRKKPSIKAKIAASLVGMGGNIKEVDSVLNGKYNEELSDWLTKTKALEPAMTYERYGNTNDRTNAYQTASTVLRERDLARKEKDSAFNQDITNKKLALQAITAQGWKLKTGKDGYIYSISSASGEQKNTGVKSGELSDLDKIQLKLDADEKMEDKRQENRLGLEDARQMNREEINNLRNDVQVELMKQRYELMGQNKWSNPVQAFDKDGKSLPFMISVNGVTGESKQIPIDDARTRVIPPGSGGSSSTTQSETQKAAGITNKARQIASNNPAWAKYIKFDNSGRFTGITRPGLIFGPKEDVHNQIYQAIYGEPFTATPVKLNENPSNQPKVGDIKTFPNGKKGKFDGKGWALVEEGATK